MELANQGERIEWLVEPDDVISRPVYPPPDTSDELPIGDEIDAARAAHALVPAGLAPGMVPVGTAERILAQARQYDDPAILWDGATTLAALAQKWNGHGHEKNEIKAAQMFAEVLLGQLLGPRPEWGNRYISHAKSSDVSGIIPPPRVSELQRLWRWTDALIEAVRNGARSRRSLLLLVDEWEAAERVAAEGEPRLRDLDIRRGDFREMLADLATESWTVGGQDALFRWIDARLGFTPKDRVWRGDS